MREIKFRGKRIDNGEWVYGDLIANSAASKPLIKPMFVDCNTSTEPKFVDPSTVGQFTGLTDKNGKEIYEGDVIGCHNPSIKHLIFYNEKQGRFMAALNGDINNDFVCVCGLDDSRWTGSKWVIGNIHDNPELIKQNKEE